MASLVVGCPTADAVSISITDMGKNPKSQALPVLRVEYASMGTTLDSTDTSKHKYFPSVGVWDVISNNHYVNVYTGILMILISTIVWISTLSFNAFMVTFVLRTTNNRHRSEYWVNQALCPKSTVRLWLSLDKTKVRTEILQRTSEGIYARHNEGNTLYF